MKDTQVRTLQYGCMHRLALAAQCWLHCSRLHSLLSTVRVHSTHYVERGWSNSFRATKQDLLYSVFGVWRRLSMGEIRHALLVFEL